jgi:hypothetical protein
MHLVTVIAIKRQPFTYFAQLACRRPIKTGTATPCLSLFLSGMEFGKCSQPDSIQDNKNIPVPKPRKSICSGRSLRRDTV